MVGEEKDKLACAICRSYLQVLAGEEVMDCLIYEQLEPVPVRQFKHGEKDYT